MYYRYLLIGISGTSVAAAILNQYPKMSSAALILSAVQNCADTRTNEPHWNNSLVDLDARRHNNLLVVVVVELIRWRIQRYEILTWSFISQSPSQFYFIFLLHGWKAIEEDPCLSEQYLLRRFPFARNPLQTGAKSHLLSLFNNAHLCAIRPRAHCFPPGTCSLIDVFVKFSESNRSVMEGVDCWEMCANRLLSFSGCYCRDVSIEWD